MASGGVHFDVDPPEALVERLTHASEMLDAIAEGQFPGIGLKTPPRPVPIVHRCPCGKPVSRNRRLCAKCHAEDLQHLAEKIPDAGTLRSLLSGMPEADQAEVLKAMKPYLRFEIKDSHVLEV